MSAVVSVVQNYGYGSGGYSGEVAKNISSMLPIDNGMANKFANPLRVPLVGIVYSFETWIRCRCDVAPTTICNNFKAWYDSGLPPAGITLTVNSDVISTYVQPINTESIQGTRIDFADANDEASSILLDGDLVDIGDYTSWLVFQLEITNAASLGEDSVDYIIQYDEA